MRNVFSIAVSGLCLLLCSNSFAEHYQLFLLTGQSNSLGVTNGGEANWSIGDDPADADVPFFWKNVANATTTLGDSGGEFVSLRETQGGFYAGSKTHWGPEISFARTLYRAGMRHFGIIKVSRGGGGNGLWSKADNPLSPPSDPVQRRLQSPPAKSNFLAVVPGWRGCNFMGAASLGAEDFTPDQSDDEALEAVAIGVILANDLSDDLLLAVVGHATGRIDHEFFGQTFGEGVDVIGQPFLERHHVLDGRAIRQHTSGVNLGTLRPLGAPTPDRIVVLQHKAHRIDTTVAGGAGLTLGMRGEQVAGSLGVPRVGREGRHVLGRRGWW